MLIFINSIGNLRLRLIFFLCVVTVALWGCNGGKEAASKLGPNPEKVQLVLYYSDGDFDWKTVGEWMLIQTGETLKVERNTIRPDAALIVQDWNREFLPVIDGPPRVGAIEMKLNRSTGVACLAERCGHLYTICPHSSVLNKTNLCQTFTVK